MSKLVLQDVANLQNESTVVTALASNNNVTEIALENTLSRDGTSPNQMLSNLDMNNYRVLNLPNAINDQEPTTYGQFTDAITAIGSGAVIDAPYVTLGNNPNLLSERVLTAGTYTSLTDSGPNGTIKVDVSDPELVALANTNSAADQVPYFTGIGTATTSTLSSYGRTLIDDADAATARATLGSVIGTNVEAWDADLDAVAGLATTGLISRTGAGTASTRTITGTANEITSTNGDGVAGNPTVSLPSALTFTGKTVTGGTYNSPALVTPALGTPASGVATNLTGTAAGLTAGNVTTNANLTGPITSVGNATSIASQTGTGTKFVVDTTPTLVTPVLGVATVTSVNKVGITAPATSATLTIPDGVTLTGPAASGTAMTLGNTETVTGVKTFGSAGAVGRLKLAGTTSGTTVLDASAAASGTLTLPSAVDTLIGKATTDILTNKTYDTAGTGNSFSINGVAATANTGTGSVVRATSPALVTPALGVPTALTLTNATGLPLSGLNTQGAYTVVANNSGSSAVPTAMDVSSITSKPSPISADIVLIQDSAASNAFKRTTVGALASAGSVASIAGNTGAFTLAGGLTNSTNQLQLDGNYTGWAIPNCTLAASVSANVLTVALKDNTGADPSATSPVYINYRNVTPATGTTTLVTQTAALSVNTSTTGVTLGTSNSTAFRFWVVVFNNGGTNVMALINCSTASQIYPLNSGFVASALQIGAGATNAGVFYSQGTAITSKAFRILGYIEYNSTGLATAGTYATAPNFIQTYGPGIRLPGETVQVIQTITNSTSIFTSSTYAVTTVTSSITPTSAANPIRVRTAGSARTQGAGTAGQLNLRRGTTTTIGTAFFAGVTNIRLPIYMEALDLPNTVSSQTYSVYMASSDNTTNVDYPEGPGAPHGLIFMEELQG